MASSFSALSQPSSHSPLSDNRSKSFEYLLPYGADGEEVLYCLLRCTVEDVTGMSASFIGYFSLVSLESSLPLPHEVLVTGVEAAIKEFDLRVRRDESVRMDPRKIAELKTFIQLCDSNPSLLQDPSLRFFRNYLEKLEAKLPPSAYGKSEASKASKAEESDDDMPELEEQSGGFKPRASAFADDSSGTEEESEVELDNSDVVEPDNDPPQKGMEQNSNQAGSHEVFKVIRLIFMILLRSKMTITRIPMIILFLLWTKAQRSSSSSDSEAECIPNSQALNPQMQINPSFEDELEEQDTVYKNLIDSFRIPVEDTYDLGWRRIYGS
ncbi:hypothetical protein L7F22_012028 [Adiantum nelumboides]|nr:hypothetical protein [Adiantum nelumboides]